MEQLFHIVAESDWLAAQRAGSYAPPSLSTEGFIHLSRGEQLAGVADRFYRGVTDLIVLSIDEKKLEADVRFEEADGELFPHLYGPLNVDAVVGTRPLSTVLSH